MKRVHLLEFEDLDAFPSWLRTCMTNNIVIIARFMGVRAVLSNLVGGVLKDRGLDRIVDLGSGGGGVMPEVLAQLHEDPQMQHVGLTMTDLFPNRDAVRRFNDAATPQLRYAETPVDATALGDAPAGLKTMSNCFHHMRPEQARAILRSAHDTRQPLLVYEMGPPMHWALWLVTMPIALPLVFLLALIQTPFIRPVTGRQLVFTYLIPLVPLFYAWDGHASAPRIYGPDDLDELLEGLDDPEYRWEKGPAKDVKGKVVGSYLLGVPVES